VLLLASGGENAAFLIVGVLGIAMGVVCYFRPAVFDGATRMRLRSQGMDENNEAALKRDRDRRRLIGSILGVVSAVILVQALIRL